jgi:hypothetical protein
MSAQDSAVESLYGSTDTNPQVLKDPDVAHLTVNHNKVLGAHLVPGLHVDVDEMEEGIDARISVDEGVRIARPVHICFGMIPKEGVQRIKMNVDIRKGAGISVLAHCVFPNAVDVEHIMDATIRIGEGASYSYLEKHVHSPEGGIKVYPRAKVEVESGGSFKTEFELIKGRVGLIDIQYETVCRARGVVDMTARISGSRDDVIKLDEIGHLEGERARGVLTSKIAVRDRARAEIRNTMTASAPGARGHVDCKEIVKDQGVALAVPVVEVNHPLAHVTHEAAIGSVDRKQLETLMARGLDDDEASELIIQGMLS